MSDTYNIHDSLHLRTRIIAYEVGDKIQGHAHAFPHLTILAGGKWRVIQSVPIVKEDGKQAVDQNGDLLWYKVYDRIVDASVGVEINIPAENKHSFEVVEGRGRYFCVYPSRDVDTGEVLQYYNYWEGAAS